MSDVLLRGLLIGGLSGIGFGPIALWAVFARREGYRASFGILFGAIIGDLFLIALALACTRRLGIPLASAFQAALAHGYLAGGSLRAAGLMVLSCVFFRMAAREASDPSRPPRRGWRIVGAFAGTVLRIDTVAAIFVYVKAFGAASDPLSMLFAGCAVGALAMWFGSTELLFRLHGTAGRFAAHLARTGAMLCVAGAFIVTTPAF